MPFKSEKQRRFLWLKHPDLAKRWAHEYPESNKGLPMYADKKDDSDEKKAALAALEAALSVNRPTINPGNTIIRNPDEVKAANSGMVKVDVKHSDKPTYAGEEREKGDMDQEGNPKADGKPVGTGQEAISAIFGKLSAVLARPLREAMEAQKALEEGREPMFVPQNLNVRRYSIPSPGIAPPMGMSAPTVANPTPQPVQQPGNTPANTSAVGGGSNPQHNPIQAFGPLGAKGQLNGNAAFGIKNSPDSLKTAAIKAALGTKDLPNWYGAEGLIQGRDGGYRYGVEHGVDVRDKAPGWLTRIFDRDPYVLREDVPKYKKRLKAVKGLQVAEEPYRLNFSHSGQLKPEMRQLIEAALAKHAMAGHAGLGQATNMEMPSGSILSQLDDDDYERSKQAGDSGAWTRAEGKNPEGGLNAKGRASLKAQGHDIKAPVTESNPSGERAKRQNSFCSRMCGMKKVNTGSKTKSDPDSRINKSLRKWNCKCGSAQDLVTIALGADS